jgi:hypothetical protein
MPRPVPESILSGIHQNEINPVTAFTVESTKRRYQEIASSERVDMLLRPSDRSSRESTVPLSKQPSEDRAGTAALPAA